MRVGLSHQFLSQALILEVHLFCVFPAACREFPILNRRGAENLTEGPGGKEGQEWHLEPFDIAGVQRGWLDWEGTPLQSSRVPGKLIS